MADEGTGRTLKPANFTVGEFKRAEVSPPSSETTPDQFGQQYNADYDKSKWSGEAPQDARRYHTRADTDLSPRALHHTLGIKHSQASPGDHIHDGFASKKIGPLEMDPVNLGQTRAVWTLPAAYTLADVVELLHKFVEFRKL